ncbi:ubinuclein-1 isoform X2 [Populus alba]|uniref:ubinuclein-1 isoform X2 n=1 Tax=Populus alba TaxID=43335 RepID=UPI00158DAB13|nr:ubinuclein-1-like isoform X2 [Populus alba]
MEAGHAKEGDTSSPPRQRFYIELKPGETTIVSWKKLLKDAAANKANPSHSNNQTAAAAASTSAFVMEPASGETAQQEALFALGQLTKPIPKNAPSSSRLGSVIEKTEQLYVGNQSSDEEELDGAPDEDQYDTKDSFIDDTELDECFEVDESTTKHNGFIVNKGKLEHMNRPISSSHFQPKKRKNNMQKAREEKDGDRVRDKHAKLGQGRMNVATGNIPMNEPFPTNTQNLAVNGEQHHDGKLHSLMYPIFSDKKVAGTDIRSEYSSYPGITNRDDSISNTGQNDTEKQMNGVLQPGNLGRIVKDTSELSRVAYQKYQENNAPGQSAPQSKRLASETSNASSPKVSHRNKKGRHELPDLNLRHYPVQAEKKTATMHPKDVSSLQPKGSMVERAIRDLEKVVAESRPRNTDAQDADTLSMSIKRRLPFEVKQKLAKVARLASSQGKISEELISHLMTILGHLIQLRTLKKNLREMVEMGLTAKQEKADRFQKIKKEVMEMIELQLFKQRDKAVVDFQKAIIHGEKGAINRKYVMDDKMEDKICDLYDLFVQGMYEDKGPQIRKLYAEVAELWPNGAMDNHGIKIAICRAKERRRIFYNNEKVEEKARIEKLSRQWKGNNVGGKATSNARAKCEHGGVSASAAIAQYLSGPARPIPSFLKSRNDDPPKQEKLEKMTFPMLKEHMKQQKREFDRGLKKSSPKVDRKSHMSHMQDVGMQDGL